ncbi:MAG: hypothetical protein ACYC69_09960 [Thermodesulfovibrionales bacterium]
MTKLKGIKRRAIMRGPALRQHIIDTISMMYIDPDLQSTKINAAEVARRSGCSRMQIYKSGLDVLIKQKANDKARDDADREKLRKSHKTTHVVLLQRIKKLQEHLKAALEEKEAAEQLMWTLFIQVEANSNKLGVRQDLIKLLNTPIDPIASKEDGARLRRHEDKLFPDLLAWGRLYQEAQGRRESQRKNKP